MHLRRENMRGVQGGMGQKCGRATAQRFTSRHPLSHQPRPQPATQPPSQEAVGFAVLSECQRVSSLARATFRDGPI